ncbi:MAG TPA: hypothetical protein ENN47_05785 [Mesotoga infera]|uniref:Dextranase n=1 Tax=Mesotoga infera TaxID=1236046 RepID=A0A7C1GT90_9BACT|nr:hypothetical protein [Mesotoga infera]
MKAKLLFLVVAVLSTFLGGAEMDVNFNKAFYEPGELLILQVKGMDRPMDYTVSVSRNLVQCVSLSGSVSHENPVIEISLPYEKGGYGLDVTFDNNLTISRGFSILDNWLESPRYGFLTEFYSDRIDIEVNMDYLAQYHINGLQYYDWMYDYGKLVYEEGTVYKDAWQRVREISTDVIRDLIDAGHRRNIFSMAYVALYAVTRELGEMNPDWLLYEKKGDEWNAVSFYERILLADNRASSGWTAFLLEECAKTIDLGFDGIHLDQYGYPKDNESFTLEGEHYKPYKTSLAFMEFFDSLRGKVDSKAVFFNYVNNWPKEIQDRANLDVVYIEPWESCNTYADLHAMIVDARKRSGGKHVILAAYIKGAAENSILLADSLIAISGGRRLEVGEFMRILSGPYFPGADVATESLLNTLRDYYDFQARYEDFIEGDFIDGEELTVGTTCSSTPQANSVWLTAKKSDAGIMINLVNLTDIRSDLWRRRQRRPKFLENLSLNIPRAWVSGGAAIYFCSPDGFLRQIRLEAHPEGDHVLVKLPQLRFWTSVLIVEQ